MPLSYSVHKSQYEVGVCLMFMQKGLTSLMLASATGKTDTVRVLLDSGAAIDLRNNVRIIEFDYYAQQSSEIETVILCRIIATYVQIGTTSKHCQFL